MKKLIYVFLLLVMIFTALAVFPAYAETAPPTLAASVSDDRSGVFDEAFDQVRNSESYQSRYVKPNEASADTQQSNEIPLPTLILFIVASAAAGALLLYLVHRRCGNGPVDNIGFILTVVGSILLCLDALLVVFLLVHRFPILIIPLAIASFAYWIIDTTRLRAKRKARQKEEK